jgi:hypothetical protein
VATKTLRQRFYQREHGKWTMTDSGKICTSVRFTSWQGSREECRYFFRVGSDIYITLSDTARATPVQKQINR